MDKGHWLEAKALRCLVSTGRHPEVSGAGLCDIPQVVCVDSGILREEEAPLTKGVHHFALSSGLYGNDDDKQEGHDDNGNEDDNATAVEDADAGDAEAGDHDDDDRKDGDVAAAYSDGSDDTDDDGFDGEYDDDVDDDRYAAAAADDGKNHSLAT